MIRSYGDKATEDLANDKNTAKSRRIPKDLWRTAKRRLLILHAAQDFRDLQRFNLEALRKDLAGLHSIRINNQWRIIFRWKNGDAFDVRIDDYH